MAAATDGDAPKATVRERVNIAGHLVYDVVLPKDQAVAGGMTITEAMEVTKRINAALHAAAAHGAEQARTALIANVVAAMAGDLSLASAGSGRAEGDDADFRFDDYDILEAAGTPYPRSQPVHYGVDQRDRAIVRAVIEKMTKHFMVTERR